MVLTVMEMLTSRFCISLDVVRDNPGSLESADFFNEGDIIDCRSCCESDQWRMRGLLSDLRDEYLPSVEKIIPESNPLITNEMQLVGHNQTDHFAIS